MGDNYSDAHNIMYMGKYRGTDNGDKNAFKLWNFGFKAAPKKNVSIAHSWTQEAVDGGEPKTKSATKLGFKEGDIKWDVAAANDKWSVKASAPLMKDDWNVKGSLMYEDKPFNAKKTEVTLNVESPDMSGTVASTDLKVEIEMNKDHSMKKKKVEFEQAFEVEKDLWVGFNAESDTEKLTSASAGVVKKDGTNKYWGLYDHAGRVDAGCLVHNNEVNFTHAYEARYTFKDGKNALWGMPLVIGAGGKYVLSGQTTMGYSFEFAEMAHAQAKFEHKIDKNWKVTAHQSFDMNNTKQQYRLGFDVNYNL